MNKRILKVAVSVGVSAAITCFIYLVLLNTLGENPFGKRKYMAIGIYGVFFAGAMWWYRDKLNKLILGFREGLILGLLMNVLSTAFYVALVYSYLSYTDGGKVAIDRFKSESEVLLSEMKSHRDDLSEEDYQTTLQNIRNFNAPSLALQQINFYHGFGVFHAFLFVFIFKTHMRLPNSGPKFKDDDKMNKKSKK